MSKKKNPDSEEENRNIENEVNYIAQVSNVVEGGPEIDIDKFFNSLSKVQEQITKIMLSDSNFKSVVDRVRSKQAAKILDLNRKLCEESKASSARLKEATLNQDSIDMFLEEVGVKADMESKKIETDKVIAALQKAEHSIVVLTKESENLKAKVEATVTENHTLQNRLTLQRNKARGVYDEIQAICGIHPKQPLGTDALNRCSEHLDNTSKNNDTK